MLRSRMLLLLLVLLVVGTVAGSGLVLSSESLAEPAVVTVHPLHRPGVVLQTSAPVAALVAEPTPQAVSAPQVLAPVAAAAPARVTINIQPGADAESQILEAVYQKVNSAVVKVVNLAHGQGAFGTDLGILPQAEGSGFLWDNQGHIVTNDHVVDGADKLQVVFADGTEADATLVGTDPNADIAVIRVDPSLTSSLVPLEQGDMAQVKVGQLAIAIGNPFGFQNTMTRGIVSALGRSIPSQTQYSIPEAIQTDAAINPGNSGGPLLNAEGLMIGINDQIDSQSGSFSGVGFAIPVDMVQRVVPALIQTGHYQHAYLGITGDTFSRSWASVLKLPADARGVYVMDATAGAPAAQAGLRGGTQDTNFILDVVRRRPLYLQSGGDLITAIDGQPVAKMNDLLLYLEQHARPSQAAQLTITRDGKQQTITVTLGVRPDQSTLRSRGNGQPQA